MSVCVKNEIIVDCFSALKYFRLRPCMMCVGRRVLVLVIVDGAASGWLTIDATSHIFR